MQLTEGRKLKRAAIVLFGKDPNRFYPNVQVKIGRFGKDSTDLKFQEIVEGNLVQMLSEVQVQLNHKFLTRPVDFVGMQRVEKDEYPVAALREMLLNALVHRTYMGAHIQLRVYDDRLSIWNEGALPCGLTVEDLKGEHNSRPRNPKIAKACFMSGYIDTWGRGTLKIYNSCKEHGLPEPAILEKDGGFMVVLYKTPQGTDESVAIGGQVGGQVGGAIVKIREEFGTIEDRIKDGKDNNIQYFSSVFEVFSEYFNVEFGITSEKLQESFRKASGKLLPNWLLILEMIAIYPDIIAEDISKIIGISERTVYTYFNELQEKKLIERIGGRKEGFWQIKKQ